MVPGKTIEFVEVGPRDGLQNEPMLVTTEQKVALIERAYSAGVRRIEATSFVHPKRVPQMADAEAVLAALPALPGLTTIGLVLNKRGALRAFETNVSELGAICSASDTFGERNQGQNAAESLASACHIVKLAHTEGRRAQISIAVAFGCPFEGRLKMQQIVDIAKAAAAAQPLEIGLADTVGVGAPGPVGELVARVCEAVSPTPVRVHFHNTRNTGMANVWAAIQNGASVVDASIGGLGGCPFAPQATGNVPSEDVAYMLQQSGIETGLNLAALIETSKWLSGVMGRPLPGMLSRAGDFPAGIAGDAK